MFFTPSWNHTFITFITMRSSVCSTNFQLRSSLENYQANRACWFCFLEWTSWLLLSCGMAKVMLKCPFTISKGLQDW
jgi:hypothetical protein